MSQTITKNKKAKIKEQSLPPRVEYFFISQLSIYIMSILFFIFCPLVFAFAEPIIPKATKWRRTHDENKGALVIDEQTIEESTATSLTELFETEGIYVTESAKGNESRITIAGLTAQNIHVYIDGVLQNTAAYGRFDWSSVDLSQVERITIYRAGYCPLPYTGSFSGAVIDIKTRGASFPVDIVDVSSSSYNGSGFDTERISASRTGVIQISSSGSMDKQRKRMPPPTNTGEYRLQPASEPASASEVSYKASAALTHAKNDYCGMNDADSSLANAGVFAALRTGRSIITADYRLSHNDVNVPPQSGQAGEEEITSHAVTLGGTAALGGWMLDSKAHYRHELTEYEEASKGQVSFFGQDQTQSDTHRLDTIAFNAALATPQWGVFSANISTKQCADILRSTAASSHSRYSGFEKVLITITLLPALLDTTSMPQSGNQHFDGSNSPVLAFDASATLDHYADTATLNPSCAMHFGCGVFGAVAAYSRLYQAPTMYQLYWSGGTISGNRALNPESGNAWTFSFISDFAPCPISTAVSYMDTCDKIRYMDSTFKNISRARIWSIEAHASPQMRIKNNLFRLRLSYVYTSAKIAGGAQDGNQIMDVPLHTFAASGTWRMGWLLTGINAEYASKRYISNWNAQYNSEYFLLGAYASMNIPLSAEKSICPYIKAENITDRRVWSDYTQTIYRPTRSFTCGVKVKG